MTGSEGGHRSPRLRDYLALWMVRLSKIGRQRLEAAGRTDRKEFYEEFFEDKDCRAYVEDPRMAARRSVLKAFLAENLQWGARVADIGCGLGDVLAELDSRYERYGIEMAESSARVAYQQSGASVVRGSASQLPIATGSLDACLCLEVLEHLKEDAVAVGEMRRVLRRRGWLVVSVPYTFYWDQYVHLMGHYRHYTRRSLRRLLEGEGFVVVRYLANYPDWHQAFTRRYALARGLHLALGPLLGCETVYDLRLPGTQRTIMEVIEERLESLRLSEHERDYSSEPTSTFVAARKVE